MTPTPRRTALAVVAVVAALVGLCSAPSASADPGGTVVTGRVVDTAGNPLTGVEVWFAPQDTNTPQVHVLAATTGRDGRYQALLTLATSYSEVYFVGANATGRTSRSGYVTRFLRAADGSPTIINPQAGATVRHANAVLAPGASASGRVTTSDGKPLGNVLVNVVPDVALPSDDLPYQTIDPVRTAANGTWSMRGLDLGTHPSVRATFEFFPYDATGGSSPTGYPIACLGLAPEPCVRGSQYTGPALGYVRLATSTPATGADIALPPAVELRGTLTTPSGTGIRGAFVTVYSPVRTAAGGVPPLTGGVVAAKDGTWRQRWLLPGVAYAVCYGYGQWYVSVNGRDGATFAPECSHDSPVTADFRAGTLYRGSPGQVVRVDDSLYPNGLVSGRVVDGNGTPIPFANVYVSSPGRSTPIGPFRASQLGTFTIRGVAVGSATLCATASGFPATCPPSRGPVTTVSVSPYRTTAAPDLVLVRS